MDLHNLDTRERAHEGVDLPLVLDGETILGDDDEPMMFRVKGSDDREVDRAVRAWGKANAGGKGDESDDLDTRVCRAAVIGWSDNVVLAGEKLAFSKANLEAVIGIPVIRRFLAGEVVNRRNFMKGLSPKP